MNDYRSQLPQEENLPDMVKHFARADGHRRCCIAWCFLAACVLLCVITGCANRGGVFGVDCCADVPAGAVPELPGTKICAIEQAQVSAANADRHVLYQADFIGRTSTLAPGALDRLARLHDGAMLGNMPLRIEPSGDVALDQSRVAELGNLLAEAGVSQVQVEVANPPALGLPGPLAENSLTGGRAFQSNRTTQSPLGGNF